MNAYEAGCVAALEKMAMTKEAWGWLAAGAGRAAAALGGRAAAGAAARGVAGAGARAAGGGMFRNMLGGLGNAMKANKGTVALNAGLGAVTNWDPQNPMKSVAGGALGAVTAPFGLKGMGVNMAGNMLMNSGGQ